MNRFHWHLVDDQGWRIQIDKYPKLTTIGATRSNSWSVDPIYGGYYTNEPYGPYFYTKEEAREIVEYAKERHIEVIPEVEFPGNACAALAAYPEFSCTPGGSHSVKVDGGIYADVFNVGNPATLQFAKDVLDEIVEIFPYSQVHIGGDECPTSAWSSNKECNDLMKAEGFSNIRELQSRFVRLLADYLREKGKEAIMWNESLSAGGTNVELIKGTKGTMMCWEQGKVQSTALQAAQLGMNSVITPWGPYYINRKQSTNPGEPVGAGSGTDDLRATYNYVPVPSSVPTSLQKYYIGVQGTFWTEHVQDTDLLEYLALPRLTAIAETGWTPQTKKNFSDFQQRITKDTLLLNYNLEGNKALVSLTVINEGDTDMPFSFGYHPYFTASKLENVEFDIKCATCSDNAKGEQPAAPEKITLTRKEGADNSVRLLTGVQFPMTLTDKGNGHKVTVDADETFENGVLWQQDAESFVCMEPWNGWANSVNEEGKHEVLEPDEAMTSEWSITIEKA